MDIVKNILQYNSVSFVGLEKNSGKTECLNYVLENICSKDRNIAATSIGLDGEKIDSVTKTDKPEITIYKGMIFVTSEKHYLEREIVSEILNVSETQTALGRLITARAVSNGKVILSGPPTTAGIKRIIEDMKQYGVRTTLVDGALSRLSLASPAITDAMILSTGASVSTNMRQLLHKTKFVLKLINIDSVESELSSRLQQIDSGLMAIDNRGNIKDLKIPSALLLHKNEEDIFLYGNRLYVPGVITSGLLDYLRMQPKKVELIIRDFSSFFSTSASYDSFLNRGNSIKCLYRTKLLAVTVNPKAPNGFSYDSDELQKKMREALGVPVYDMFKLKNIS